MARKLVKLKLHGSTWDGIPSDWEFCAKDLGSCLRLLELNTKKFYKTLYLNDQKNIKYQIILNGKKFYTDNPPDINKPETIYNSELALKRNDLETIDIVPVIEGADSDTLGIVTLIIGVILIALGPVTGGLTVIPGILLIAAGIFTLLSKPPKFEDFREIEQGGKTSYLFSGPQNIIGEGGPVPVGYGKLIIGSQVVSTAYVIRDFNTADTSSVVRDEYGNLTFLPKKKPAVEQPPFNCCFIFIQGEGELTQIVRNYRNLHYGNTSFVAFGYKWMANWLVPLMKKNIIVQKFIKYFMTTPLSKYAEWYFNKNNYGWIFWPFKIWVTTWRTIGFLIKK